MNILIVDEHDCFGRVSEFLAVNPQMIKPSFFMAPDKSFLSEMSRKCKESDLVIIHRHIWTDDCHKDDAPCNGILSQIKKDIFPAPVIEVGGDRKDTEKCPSDILDTFKEIMGAIEKFGQIIGSKVNPINAQHTRFDYLIIDSLETVGTGKVGCILKTPEGEKKKYFLLDSLSPYQPA
jgi:hypothetical protein